MEANTRTPPPVPSFLHSGLAVLALIAYPLVAVYQWASRAHLVPCESFAELGLYVSGLPLFIYHSTTVPRYYVHVLSLTVWAYLTGQSFVVRYAEYPPRFIARPGSRDLRTFPITLSNNDDAYMQAGVPIRNDFERKWRPERLVAQRLHLVAPFYHSTPDVLDLRPYHLVGPRWTQGYGIIGHEVRLALIEEYGRWPGEIGLIAGRLFNWQTGDVEVGKIPIEFVSAPGVEETVEGLDSTIVVQWQDLGAGLRQGIRAVAILNDGNSVSTMSMATSSSVSLPSTESAASLASSEVSPVLPDVESPVPAVTSTVLGETPLVLPDVDM